MLRLARQLTALALAFGITFGLVMAEDEVQRRTASVPVRGTISGENANEVTVIRKDNGKTETVPVREIAKVKYEGGKASADFIQAESLEKGLEYQKAIDAYSRIAQESAGKEFLVRAANFGKVSTLVRQAERDSGKVDEAISAIEDFRKQNPNSRFHYTLHEMLGQIELNRGNAQAAGAAFAELAKAPWPDLKLKAANYEARILVAAGQFDAAIARFDEVAKSAGDSSDEKSRRFEALLGKTECLVKQKKHQEAEKIVREVIDSASGDESGVQAAAFNFRGDVQRETGKPKDAIFSYLYVDFFYSNERVEHAKSLYYIAQLWDQLGRPDRAEDARSRLKKDYPNSPWVKTAEPPAKVE